LALGIEGIQDDVMDEDVCVCVLRQLNTRG
jgi:hypothetical protein